jgi:microcystin-dependent protein
MSISDGIIATTLSNADITILANGDGSVIVSDLYTDGIVETALLNVSATNQSVTVDTGAAVIAGGLGVGRTVNIGGDLHVGGVIYGTTSISAIPAGAVMHFAMVTPPAGWMICNGAQVSRAVYADLFAAIGTTFGAGNGTTTFNLPDLRGEFIRGYDSSRGLDTGRTFGSNQADGIKSHSHEWYLGQNAGTLADRKIGGWNFTGTYKASAYGTNTFVGTTGISETRPVNVALQPCIKY